jgi:hypothetical protein
MRATAICTSDKVGGEKLDIVLGYSIHCNGNHIMMMPRPKKKKNCFLGSKYIGSFHCNLKRDELLKIIIKKKVKKLGNSLS